MSARNGFEASGRRRKVRAFVAVLEQLDQPPSADDVAAWDAKPWATIAEIATRQSEDGRGFNPPSAETVAEIVKELRRREEAAALGRAS